MTGCDDILDRPQLTKPTDDNYWRNETDVRLHANDYYPNYFVGYNSGWGTAYTPLRGYYFSDDNASGGQQSNFENTVPSTRGATTETPTMLEQYAGPNWNFAFVRKLNIFLNRLETKAKPNLSEEAYAHWIAVAKFLKAYEYTRLVTTFGDVPYFEKEVSDTDFSTLYKDRDDRGVVMDNVYNLLKDALATMRTNDGTNYLNRYVAAAFASRFMLFEGTWQKYHSLDAERAKKYLQFAVEAAEIVINSGNYQIATDFRTVFGSQDLKGNKEVLMYRHYDAGKGVTHHIASYSNGQESQSPAPNLALAKSFICNDGKVYQNSSEENAAELNIKAMIQTRDPRFEATFYDHARKDASTLLYACKFIDRNGSSLTDPGSVPMYGSMTNTNDGPVIRYAEVLLNWIEAKAELALSYGGSAITQTDIDNSINALRDRPLDAVAESKGIKKTAHMKLVDINSNFDPARDKGHPEIAGDYEVDPLIWEIRRERRMELVYEYSRLLDLKRWKKLHYMDNEKYPDTMLGLWIDMPKELPAYLEPDDKTGKYSERQVMKEDGTIISFKQDGSNKEEMIGYYVPYNAVKRNAFTERSYCAPVGKAQIDQYKDKGFKLTQTKGW